MKTRLKRIIKRILGISRVTKVNRDQDDRVKIDENRIIIKRDMLRESLPYINELAEQEDNLIPRRKVTFLKWYGPTLEIEGYFYLENIPMNDEDLVKKRLVLVSEELEKIEIPLEDVKVDELNISETIDEEYIWAGFTGKTNFSTIELNDRPLQAAEYKAYLQVEVQVLGDRSYQKLFPVGNIKPFLDEGFHSAKMEFFSARRELKYNLLATYDKRVKTLKIKSTKLKDFDPALMNEELNVKPGVFYRMARFVLYRGTYRLFCMMPLKPNKVLFASDSRSDMTGNFEFVFNEMLKRDLDFDYCFMLKSKIHSKKSLAEIAKLAYHFATSKFIFLDDFYPLVYPLKIREGAELIQLWHAVGAFKTFGYSRMGLPGGPSPRSKNHRNYTKAIVSSKNIAKYYAEGFGIKEDKVKATGIPRTDVFFDELYQQNVKDQLYKTYPFLRDKKVIMFAPTFRGNGQRSAYYPMEELELNKLYHALKDEYVFIYKIHPFVQNDFSIPYEYSDFFYDFSSYREINDLLFITDVLITDYSSVCFEYALLNRPMIFFAYDVEKYVEKRDFYFDYHSFVPGPLVRSTDEIIEKIETKAYKMEKIEPFVEYFFEDTDGKSSERVVDELVLGIEDPSEK